MSFLRNRLDYYGELVAYSYYKENYKNWDLIIGMLLKLAEK